MSPTQVGSAAVLALLLLSLVSADPDAEVLAEAAAQLTPPQRAAFEKKAKALPKKKRLKLSPDELLAIARIKQGLLQQNREQANGAIMERLGVGEEEAAAWLKKHKAERKILEKLTPEQTQQLKDEEARVLDEKNKEIDQARRDALRALLATFVPDAGVP